MPELEKQQIPKRQVAYKVKIKDILDSIYVKEDGWQPNYIEINGNKISRVNLIGTVVLKTDKNSIILDDGTGKINLRVFEDNSFFRDIDVGDVALSIGRPREFGSEKYIMPEVLKKIEDVRWIKVRKMELKLNNIPSPKKEEKAAEEVVEEIKDETPYEKILSMVKGMDKGDGVDIGDILSKDKAAEKIINSLLEKGEIFEIKSGRVKVLE